MANLDLFVVTFACATPDFSFLLADKLLALAELAHIPSILVLNKLDQAPAGLVDEVRAVYEPLGYKVFAISAQSGTGVAALREHLKGKICAFGGPSGVGKSSTINAIDSSVELRTGEVTIRVNPGCAGLVETRTIDGVKYILIRADEGVCVNGVNVDI